MDRTQVKPLLLALLLWLPGTLSGAEWYVSASATGGGDGSRGSPFASLAQAETASAAGDTIYLLASDRLLDGSIELRPRQRLLGVNGAGELLVDADAQVRVGNTGPARQGIVVRLADHNEVAGIHFLDMANAAIAAFDKDFSGAHLHHNTFTGNADQHVEDERGLVYAISLDASSGQQRDIVIEDSGFYNGQDLGAIRVFHAGDSSGSYLFQRNDFSDLGGRPYFVRTQHRSRAETIILDSSADNIGLGDRNSDSIIPYLMGQSEQVMLVRNYHFRNSKRVGNESNTAIEAYLFGYPRPDQDNWCSACKLTFKIYDSLIEDAVTDAIQFSNAGRNSQLSYEIRNTRIIGGTPRQGEGGISLNLQSVADSGSRTSLLVENTEVNGTSGYGFALNNRGGGDDYSVVVDLGGGPLGSSGNNRFSGNERGDMRITSDRVHAANNRWNQSRPRVFDADNGPHKQPDLRQ